MPPLTNEYAGHGVACRNRGAVPHYSYITGENLELEQSCNQGCDQARCTVGGCVSESEPEGLRVAHILRTASLRHSGYVGDKHLLYHAMGLLCSVFLRIHIMVCLPVNKPRTTQE